MPSTLRFDARSSLFRPDWDLRTAALTFVAALALSAAAALTISGAAQTLGARTSLNVQNAVNIVHDRYARIGSQSTFEIRIADPKGRPVTIGFDGRTSGTAITSTFPAPASITAAEGTQQITFATRPHGDIVFNLTLVPSRWGRIDVPVRVAIGSDVTVDTALDLVVTP